MSCPKNVSSEKFDENKSNKINMATKNKPLDDKQCINNNNKKNNMNNNKAHYNKHNRKRSQTMPGSKCHKRRRIEYTRRFIPPTKFLLGGNIHDPLNLNSLQDEDINRAMNAVTPKSSPLPTPQHRKGQIEVIIPPNICDPLNLAQCDDENTMEYEAHLISPIKKMKRPKKKRKKSGCTTDIPTDNIELQETPKVESSPFTFKEVITESAPNIKSESSATKPILNEVAPEMHSPVPTFEPAIPDEGAQTISSEANQEIKKPIQTTNSVTISPSNKKLSKKDSVKELDLKNINKLKGLKDKIVSPVIPQPTHHGVTHSRYRQLTPQISQGMKTPNFREKNCKFQYGNYNKYYGYRNSNQEIDPRIKILDKFHHLFQGKDVLDIGCNIGHITLTVARDFGAKSIVGLDIDKHLIKVARTNIKHYVNCKNSPIETNVETTAVNKKMNTYTKVFTPSPSTSNSELMRTPNNKTPNVVEDVVYDNKLKEHCDVFFPISMPIVYGGINIPGIPSTHSDQFPHNVSFVQGNYVLESDVLLNMEQSQFDVILCLSVTKWFHLNWGDSGLKRVFKRMYAQLRNGGVLIIEPQAWNSYKKKNKLTESIWRNFQSIQFFPQHFQEYLLSEVGFTKCEYLGSPLHSSKGFQRPIKMFTKGYDKQSKGVKARDPSGEWT